ncbi:hypothetical protein [Kitasatospora sp. NPDC047058]|uniref:hypothetical protein n=1 Tax=Kitasatospora sp. NPDC047058 TaxID=3155620 RepID=UPI0034064ED8
MTEFLAVSGAVFWVLVVGFVSAVAMAVAQARWERRQARRRAFRDIEQLLKKEARR